MDRITLRQLVTAFFLTFAALMLSSCAAPPAVRGNEKLYVITPTTGIAGCTIGDDETNFQQEFGGRKEGSYWISKEKGVDVNTADGKITAMFFYFYSKDHRAFNGKTVEGIGAESTLDDVIRSYGRPEEVMESTVSNFGAMPGAREKHLDYSSAGMAFVFWGDRLADIRIYKRRQ